MPAATQTDDRTTAAWSAYRDATRELDGDAYRLAEEVAWAALQDDLDRIARAPHARPAEREA